MIKTQSNELGVKRQETELQKSPVKYDQDLKFTNCKKELCIWNSFQLLLCHNKCGLIPALQTDTMTDGQQHCCVGGA